MDREVSNGEEQIAPAVHSHRYAQINHLLTQRRLGMGFPGDLEAEFRRTHDAESARLFRANAFYVLLLYLALGAGIMTIVPVEQLDRWPLGYFGVGLIIISAIIMSRRGMLDQHYDRYVGALAFIGMTLVIALPSMISDPLMTQVSMIGVIHAVVVIGAVLGLRFVSASITMWGGGITGLLILSLFDQRPDWLMLHQTFTGGCLIGMFLAWVMEKRSRLVFLQQSLLSLEKQRSDNMAMQMRQMSREDGLTKLANRRHFDEVLGREWLRCQRDGSALSLLFLDVDFFKPFNDHYGHQAGDHCLEKIAEVLRHYTRRPGDLAARYGGEEFVILYPQTGPEALEVMARQILESILELEVPHSQSPISTVVTASIGLATLVPEASKQPEDLVRAADHAVYMAKRKGRNRLWRDEQGASA